ncbi:peptidoglycan-binding protein [Nocardiopsis sp. FR4]|uniref:peptidoglycan-binding domain-containing protein n=1 Tax=Nocardiopsis sp. FR4 TaxID=2605985 RepID=UPI0013586B08|nr:peptidoglycan-binding domain-containing protein [Nocardiopsis sp. FR4]
MILLDNSLSGEPGTRVSDTTLADSATAGTVTVRAAGSRAVYDDTYSVHSQGGIRLESGHHRGDTPALRVALPSTPWALRWYMRAPSLQSAGFGTNEVRWVADSGGPGLLFRESAGGLAQVRAQPRDLAAELLPHEFTGPGIRLTQVLRVELRQDTDHLAVRVFAEHDEQVQDSWTFPGFDLSGTLSLTGYRYRARPTLYWGDQGSAVRELQLDLIDLGYDLGQWKADGDFGNATYEAVRSFQRARGIFPEDGIPGPETRAGVDFALGRVPPPLWFSHLALSDGSWVGPAALPPEPPPPQASYITLGLPI